MAKRSMMWAAQLIGPMRSELVQLPVPEPSAGQALIEVKACGVCASELATWTNAEPGSGRQIGHEPAGIVREVGPGITAVKVGDRVTGRLEPSFAEYVVADEADLAILPDNVPYSLGLGEPLGCIVEAERRTGARLGDRVAVVGLGFMGLTMLGLMARRGPSQLVAIDVRRDALDKALELGADEAHQAEEVPDRYRLTEFTNWETQGAFDVVVEASGTQAGLSLASELVRAHGVLSIVGYHQGGLRSVDVAMWNWKAIDVVNAHVRRRADLAKATKAGLDLIASGRFSFAPLVTHHFRLDELDAAFAALRDKPPGFVKAVIDVRPPLDE